MKVLFVLDGKVVGHGTTFSPNASITSDIAGTVSYAVADDSPADIGWLCEDFDGVPAFSPPEPIAPKVSPIEFKLLFTAQERVAIKEARGADPVIDDFFEIVEDPRLTHVNLGLQSTKDALAYLEAKGLITIERRQEILAGQVQ